MTNIVTLKTNMKTNAKTKINTKAGRRSRAYRRQGMASSAVGLVVIVLTGLSLAHLSHGIEIVTHAAAWEAWAMAMGIDLGFVVLELAQLSTVRDTTARKIGKYIKPAIVGTLLGSALMNAFAFGAAAAGYMVIPAVAFGIAIPGMIYAMTRVAATLWIER